MQTDGIKLSFNMQDANVASNPELIEDTGLTGGCELMELPEVGSSIRIRPPAGRKRSNVLRGSAPPARGRNAQHVSSVLGADIHARCEWEL